LSGNKKTAIAGGFWLFGLVCCCVNLPLFHRLEAGMAKPKIAGKEYSEGSVAHGRIRKKVKTTITPTHEYLQAFYPLHLPWSIRQTVVAKRQPILDMHSG
jgi:hypothetical protein